MLLDRLERQISLRARQPELSDTRSLLSKHWYVLLSILTDPARDQLLGILEINIFLTKAQIKYHFVAQRCGHHHS